MGSYRLDLFSHQCKYGVKQGFYQYARSDLAVYGSRSPTELDGGRSWPCQAASHPSYLPVIVPLFDELVHYFLHLPVALHLQVLDESVQPPWPIVGLHNGLVGLHNASNPCTERGSTEERLKQEFPSSLDPEQSYTGPQTGPDKGSFTP